jgi:hypothetical protein
VTGVQTCALPIYSKDCVLGDTGFLEGPEKLPTATTLEDYEALLP